MIELVKKKIKAGPTAAFSTELTVHRDWWWVLRSRNKASDGRKPMTVSVHCLKRVPESSRMVSLFRHLLCSPHPTSGSMCECLYKHTHTHPPNYPTIKQTLPASPAKAAVGCGLTPRESCGIPIILSKVCACFSQLLQSAVLFSEAWASLFSSENVAKKCCTSTPQDCRGGKGGSPVERSWILECTSLGFKSWFLPLGSIGPWAQYLTSLCLSFLFYKMWLMIVQAFVLQLMRELMKYVKCLQ